MVIANSIDPTFKVSYEPTEFGPSLKVVEVVDAFWRAARAETPALFDGSVLHVIATSETEMKCTDVPYRFIYAQEKHAELRKILNLCSAAVTGVLCCDGKIVVGRRSMSVTQCAGLLELVPSGSLTSLCKITANEIDYKTQILNELKEEVGIISSDVVSVRPFLLLRDDTERVEDICCLIKSSITEENLISLFRTSEYSHLSAYLFTEVVEMVRTNPDGWVPASVAILDYCQRNHPSVLFNL